MITLKEWMEVVKYRISEGSDYCWTCYGPNAYCLDSWDGNNFEGHSFSVIFDTRTQEVYEVQAHDYLRDRAYRMINPAYSAHYQKECKERGNKANEAWENVDYVDLEVVEDWVQKAQAIAQGQDYDTRVSIPVDFTDEELLKYMKLAHEQDMTFNQFVEEALRNMLEEVNRDPEGARARAQAWIND